MRQHEKRASQPTRPPEMQRVYEVFSVYQIQIPIEGCPCCVTKEEIAQLHAQPMENLGRDILDRFIWSAGLTWGELNDLKHFLPRILELTLCSKFDLWILGTRLKDTQWREWPNAESAAIRDFLQFAWKQAVQKENEPLVDWLELFTELQEPITELIPLWMNSPVAGLRCEFAEWIASGNWQNQEISDICELFTPQFIDALESQFFEHGDGPCADNYAQAVDLLRSMALWKTQNEN